MIWGSIHHSWWQWPTPQGQVLPAPAVQGLHSSTHVESIINSTVIVSGQAPGLCLSSAGVHNHIYLWLSCYGPYFFYITCQNSSTVLLLNQRFYTPAQYLENCAYLFSKSGLQTLVQGAMSKMLLSLKISESNSAVWGPGDLSSSSGSSSSIAESPDECAANTKEPHSTIYWSCLPQDAVMCS